MLYPHEVAVWDEPVPAFSAKSIVPFEAAMHEALVRARFQREPQRSRTLASYFQRAFVLYNGYAPYDFGKHQFLEVIHSLGYGVPASILVQPGEAERHRDAIRRLDDQPFRFLKPLLGTMGWGLYVATSSDEAVQFLARQCIPYLVQAYLPPQEEWRYILHRTWSDLTNTRMPSIRMAYEKLGPSVRGTGLERLRQLRKRVIWREPKSGALLRYRRLPDPARLEEIDALMTGLLVAYESRIGTQLATLCIDLGFTRHGPVVYESQIPFGDPYHWLGEHGQYTAASRAFDRSLTWSGVVMRDRGVLVNRREH